jgi:hypothetical protein
VKLEEFVHKFPHDDIPTMLVGIPLPLTRLQHPFGNGTAMQEFTRRLVAAKLPILTAEVTTRGLEVRAPCGGMLPSELRSSVERISDELLAEIAKQELADEKSTEPTKADEIK